MKRAEIIAKTRADKVVFHKNGTITAKYGYFYRMERTPEKYAASIKKAIPEAEIIESGDHWHEWVGGGVATGSARSSYMWVNFKI